MALVRHVHRRRWAAAAIAAALFTSMGVGGVASGAPAETDAPAKPGPVDTEHRTLVDTSKFKGLDTSRSGSQDVFVQFAGTGAADTAAANASKGAAKSKAAAKARKGETAKTATSVVAQARGADSGARELFRTSNSIPGVAITADTDALKALAARSDVVKITPLVPKTITNSSATQLTRALNVWQDLGQTGKGIRVGIIDTGIDYTHADFGGPGTVEAFEAAKADEAGSWTPTAKVVGGYDFAGNGYNAAAPVGDPAKTPKPDGNPLDCNGHGSHVAGTTAGIGVNADGTTFAGDYSKLTGAQLDAMEIGPGVAPEASLYALKVFGCEGSTSLTGFALDWSLDPNGDGDFADHLDLVNLSLGAAYGVSDDPETLIAENVNKHGVLTVFSAGNENDLTDVGGSPGNAIRALTVASTIDALQRRDGIKVDAPAELAGIAAGQFSIAYPWATSPPVTGSVVALPAPNADGCTPLSAAEAALVAGKVAWLEWDDNDATRRCGSVGRATNVQQAGAIGAIFTSGLNVFGAGITGSAVIPVIQLPQSETDRLRPAVEAGTLVVTFDGSLAGTINDVNPAITDTLSSFSSRGNHGSYGVVKPDVAAPGDTISSAGVGTGNKVSVKSGTSMAAPHVAGIATLVKAGHPAWTPEQIKAAVMNTAGHDVYTGTNKSGDKYGPARVGAGRVDSLSAVQTTLLAYTTNTPGAVSASFGVVPAPVNQAVVTKTRTLKVQNTGAKATEVVLTYDPVIEQPGVSYKVSPRVVKVPARGSATATITMTVRTKDLRKTLDPTMAAEQVNPYLGTSEARQYVSDASGRVLIAERGKADLRVPVYGAAKPVSLTTSRAGKIAGDPAILLKGTGVAQGSGSTAFNSLVSVLQLGATSPRLPECTGADLTGCAAGVTDRSSDLRYVGAGASPGANGYADGMLWFGIATWADWAQIGAGVQPFVNIDVNSDNKADYQVVVEATADTDLRQAVVVDLASGDVIDLLPVNYNAGDVDTNVFDNNVLLIPVNPATIGVQPHHETFPITYQVSVWDGRTREAVIDAAPAVAFDAADPGVGTIRPLHLDQGKVGIDYTLGSAVAKSGTKALVLHLHGAVGKRAEVVSLPGQRGRS